MLKLTNAVCVIALLGIVMQDTSVCAVPIYPQPGIGRRISNGLDEYYAGGMKEHPIYEGYVRPITHGIWHDTAGALKWVGNQFGGNWDYQHEFDRADTQYDRVGHGRYRREMPPLKSLKDVLTA